MKMYKEMFIDKMSNNKKEINKMEKNNNKENNNSSSNNSSSNNSSSNNNSSNNSSSNNNSSNNNSSNNNSNSNDNSNKIDKKNSINKNQCCRDGIIGKIGANIIANCLIFSIFPILIFYLMEMYEHNPFSEIRFMASIFNIMLFEIIGWLLLLVTGRVRCAIRLLSVMTLIFGLVNHYVMLFRSTPFVPWDVFSINTAASVASNYDFTPSLRVVIVSVIFIAIIIAVHFLRLPMEKSLKDLKLRGRAIPSILLGIILCLFVNLLQDEKFQNDNYLYPFLFTPAYMTKVNGMAVTFAMNLQYIAVEKPQGYSAEKVEMILSDIESEEFTERSLPNIIVIMDEAFSDLSVLGKLETNTDYMPFVHSLQKGYENTVTGNLNVSVCGGNTANTEFEFLTGCTMSFLPSGSIPYQQYIKQEVPSLASYLKSLGYETYAQHPYYEDGWNRNTVYPLLGFDNLTFLQDYSNKKIIRKYVSDETSFDKVIDAYENKPVGKPAFIFNVTMQNHGSYSDLYANFEQPVYATEVKNESLDQYLSLIRITDSEFEKLIGYFSDVDEDTVIVFFGDHQPNDSVANSVLDETGIDFESSGDTELALRYKVPYVIWANYDIDEGRHRDTSANYLAANVLKLASVPLDQYYSYQLEQQESVPIISSVQIQKKTADADEWIDNYKIIQYNRLFDWED